MVFYQVKKKTKTEEERKNKSSYDTLVENKITIEKEIENSNIDIAEIDKKININREQQEKLEENRVRVQTKKNKEDEIENLKKPSQ